MFDIKVEKDENGNDKVFATQKIDYEKTWDFSTIDDIKVEEISKYRNILEEAINEFTKDYAREMDKHAIKSALYKAKLYDLKFNPYTVTEHEKHKMIQDFCKWLLTRIEEDKLNKKEIVSELKHYSKV